MSDAELKLMCQVIESAVKRTVNGKIDGIQEDLRKHNERHEADMVLVQDHITKVEPYLQGAAGVKIVGNALKWVASIGIAWLAIRGFFPNL